MGGDKCFQQECRTQNIDLLRFVTGGMHSRGIKYWLDFGGLLGVIREGDMIQGDDDMDICATTGEFDKIMTYFDDINNDANQEYFVEQNKKYRVCGNTNGNALMLYQIRPKSDDNKALLDLFFFEELHEGVLQSMWTKDDDTHIETIFPLKTFYVQKWGFSVNIPRYPTKRLVEKYGEEYMTPSDKAVYASKFKRGTKVFGRCLNNRYRYTTYHHKLCFLIILLVFVFLVLNATTIYSKVTI